MWLIVLVLVGVVIYFLFQVSKSKGSDGSIIETPLDILKKRYAKPVIPGIFLLINQINIIYWREFVPITE